MDKKCRKRLRTKLRVRKFRVEVSTSSSDDSDNEKCESKKICIVEKVNPEVTDFEVSSNHHLSDLQQNDYQSEVQQIYKNDYLHNSRNFFSSSDSECTDLSSSNRSSMSDDQDTKSKHLDVDSAMSEESCDEMNRNTSVVENLRKWAIQNTMPHVKVTSLLKVLKPAILELPECAETFFSSKIESKYKVEDFGVNDKFVYFGIEEQLKRMVNPAIHKTNILKLQFNCDGLPIYNSSQNEFWPILGKIFFEPDVYKPFNIMTYCGEGKPKSLKKYCKKFVDELNRLLSNGVDIGDRHFEIQIMCFICDRPARAFLKGIKGHTAYYSCERCVVQGCRFKNRTVYPSVGCELRTDNSFRQIENPEHHNEVSPLIFIEPKIDMVGDFILDSMHLAFIGVMKKLMVDYWLASETKLSRENIMRLSQRMTNISNQIPCEFQRTTRSLGLINKWKATEFRFFSQYCGPLVTKDILPSHLQDHFILFYAALRILNNQSLINSHLDQARCYLTRFVLLCQQFYGLESEVSNIHSLVHLCDDVERFQCTLSQITAFPFENELGQLKKVVHGGYKPLHQLCKRMSEKDLVQEKVIIPKSICILQKVVKKGKKVIKKIKYKNFTLRAEKPNNIVLLKNKQFKKIDRIYESEDNKLMFDCTPIEIIEPAFNYPKDIFAELQIFKVNINNSAVKEVCFIENIQCKAILLNIFECTGDEETMYTVPLLHI